LHKENRNVSVGSESGNPVTIDDRSKDQQDREVEFPTKSIFLFLSIGASLKSVDTIFAKRHVYFRESLNNIL